MVSDSDLIQRLREFLDTSDLSTTTTSIVRRQLEKDFDIDLSDRKLFIREQVDEYMQTLNQQEESNQDGVTEEQENQQDEEETDGKTRTRKRKKSEVKKKGHGGGFTKLMSLSPDLQEFTGVPEMARTEVVKKLWVYIKEKNLQDPSNKRNIICDDTLRNIFRVNKIDMFQMNKVLTKHIWPVESDEVSEKSAPRQKAKKQKPNEDENEEDEVESEGSSPPPKPKKRKQVKDEASEGSPPPPKPKKRKQVKDEEEYKPDKKEKKGGFLAPVKLSDALVKFFGTGETELPRSDVVKKIWDYIKLNKLQDPSDKRQILCDEKLKELFDVDTFHGFSVAKFLKAHLVKAEQ